jgi:hypothetical protein
MAKLSQVFNIFKQDIANGTIDLDTDTDLKVMLVMTNSTSGSSADRDFDTIGSITTLDEFNGSGYTGGHGGADRKTLGSKTMLVDDGNDRGEFDFADVVWTALGSAVRSIEGALVFKENTSDGDSVPLFYIKWPSPIAATGGDITMQIDAEGALHLT